MKLTVVGCTGSMSGPFSPASSYLVQARGEDPHTGQTRMFNVLMDLGPGSFGALWRYIDARKIDAVLFSHLHADHMGDVVSLHVHRRWYPTGPLGPITLAGPVGLMDRVRGVDGVGAEETYAGEFIPHVLKAGEALTIGPLTFTPYEANHTVPAFGFRVEGPSEGNPDERVEIAYTGDTDTCDSIVEMARGVKLLMSEAGFTNADEPRGVHLTGARAGAIAKEAGVELLVLTHIQPWTDPQVVIAEARTVWDGAISTAYAGATYTI
ncbi:MAG: MBL fold metallo-hydrolase [Actinomycetaceae bacterium]|nr:MBL fold metallo-hydrolase [Actinomycetaceae bacterium]